MSRVRSERVLAAVVVVTLAVGVLVDLAIGDVEAPERDIAAAGDALVSRAQFCPPPLDRDKTAVNLAIAADPETPSSVGIVPGGDATSELGAGRLLVHRATGPAVEVVGYGALLHVAALFSSREPVQGADAARCPRVVSDTWYFGEGSSSLGYDERLVIRNPFPDEAVVAVSFFTPSGKSTKANLGELAVPAGETRVVKVNDFILRQPALGVEVEAERGRVVAWRALFAHPDDRPSGVQFTAGATAPAAEWFFPEGVVDSGVEEIINLVNPNGEEAIVSVSLLTATERLQPPKLLEVRVPPNSLKPVSLPASLGRRDQDLGSVGTIVQSTNGVGVVAERTIWYAAVRSGVASEVGATRAYVRWVVPPASVGTTEDSLVLMNPSSERATVSISLLRQDGDPVAPGRLENIRIKAQTRVRIALGDYTQGAPFAAAVVSDVPLVAERVASTSSGDVSSVMGSGVRPTAP